MTAGNGKPCKRCGTSEWCKYGGCKECARDRGRRWNLANPDKLAERGRRWALNNPGKVTDKTRRWQKANPDKKAEAQRRWNQANPDRANANTQRRRTRKTEAGGSYTAAEWRELCNHYGNKCLRCGRDDVKLTPDHILPVVKGGNSNIDNIQPLCKSCNSSKKDRHIDYRPDAGPLRWLQCKLFG